MKKLISLLAAVAMVSTLFVSVVKADFAPTVSAVVGEKVTNADFHDYMDEDIPDGYDVYPVAVSFSDLGDLTCSIKAKKHTGRKLQGFGVGFTFSDISKVDTDYTMVYDDTVGVDSSGFDGSTFNVIKNAGSAPVAYPTTAGTIADADGIEDAFIVWVVIESGADVTAALSSNINVVNYAADVYGEEEQTNSATVSPASISFAPAAATTYTYTFKTADGTGTIASADIAEGETVTAPTTGIPEIAGKDFVGWATSVGGAVVSVDSTSKANTTYYAVYEDSAPAYDVIAVDTTEQAAKVVDGTEKTYTDYDNNPVPVTKGYAIARFKTDISSAKEYKLHCEAPGEEAKDKPMNFGGIEISGIANFVVILKNAPAGATMEIRATDK
jgi:hypothetical protein